MQLLDLKGERDVAWKMSIKRLEKATKQSFKKLSLSIREYGGLTGVHSKKEPKIRLEA